MSTAMQAYSPQNNFKRINIFYYDKSANIDVQINIDFSNSEKISTNALKILAAKQIFKGNTLSEKYVLQKIIFLFFRNDEKNEGFKFKDDKEHFISASEVNRIFIALKHDSRIIS